MTGFRLQNLTVSQLVDRFAENATAQNNAIEFGESGKYNRLFKQMQAITDELKARGEDAQLQLLSLYNHKNIQVRFQAATRTLSVAPVAARSVIEAIANSRHYPQAADASLALSNIDGKFRTVRS